MSRILHTLLLSLLFSVAGFWFGGAQLPPPPNPLCTNCPVQLPVNGLTNDPLLHFDATRRVPFSEQYQLNTWQWWTHADTNALHVYDASGNYLPGLDEANCTNHANLLAAWHVQPHASNVLVAVIDQGLHGAQVASMAAAPGGDGLGMAGAARRVPVLVLPTHYGAGQVAQLIQQATQNGARLINLSFGYVDATPPVSVIEAMTTNSGVLFVLAALNGIGSEDNSRDWLCLAQLPNAICVTATTKAGTVFGAYGTNIHVGAPGRRVVVDDDSFPFPASPANLSDEPTGEPRGLWSVTGTSFAAGLVSGIAALCMERHPTDTPAQIVERLCVSAGPIAGPYQTRCGGVDAFKALTWCREPWLGIGRDAVLVGGPAGSVATVGTSAEPGGPWVAWATVTNTGWPQALPAQTTDGKQFWRLL